MAIGAVAAAGIKTVMSGSQSSVQKTTYKNLHWSFYLFAIGTLAAISVLACALILKLGAVFAITNGFFALTQIIAAVVVWRFSPLKGLDYQVNKISEQLKEQTRQVQRLDLANQTLTEETSNMRNLIQQEKQMMDEGTEKVNKQVLEINTLTKQIHKLEGDLKKVKDELVTKTDEYKKAMQQDVHNHEKLVEELHETVDELVTEVKPFTANAEKIDTEADRVIEEIQQAKEELQKTKEQVELEFRELQKDLKQAETPPPGPLPEHHASINLSEKLGQAKWKAYLEMKKKQKGVPT